MVHDTIRRSQHNVTELPGRQQVGDPLLNLTHTNIESWGNNTALIDTPVEVDDNFPSPMVVDMFKLANVACLT